ncbi:MAG: chromate resistance protein [Ramlibacter sp.]|nr:chromate resistance protein [Ramlibacter sp.]
MDTASHSISPDQFAALSARPNSPRVIDVRRTQAFEASGRILPRALRCAPEEVERLASTSGAGDAIVYCVHGHEVSMQAAAQLRAAGWNARYLSGGIEAQLGAGLPSIRKRPDFGVTGGQASRWITRARPKIDRIACPWLVRRFIDPKAEFFYVPTTQVFAEAERLAATAYDIPGAPVSHQGELCSFDVLLNGFDLQVPALDRLARIVRGADTDRLALAPQSAGLLAFSLGLSRLHADDQAMLEAAMPLYDALYAWCESEATAVLQGLPAETHNWSPDALPKAAR